MPVNSVNIQNQIDRTVKFIIVSPLVIFALAALGMLGYRIAQWKGVFFYPNFYKFSLYGAGGLSAIAVSGGSLSLFAKLSVRSAIKKERAPAFERDIDLPKQKPRYGVTEQVFFNSDLGLQIKQYLELPEIFAMSRASKNLKLTENQKLAFTRQLRLQKEVWGNGPEMFTLKTLIVLAYEQKRMMRNRTLPLLPGITYPLANRIVHNEGQYRHYKIRPEDLVPSHFGKAAILIGDSDSSYVAMHTIRRSVNRATGARSTIRYIFAFTGTELYQYTNDKTLHVVFTEANTRFANFPRNFSELTTFVRQLIQNGTSHWIGDHSEHTFILEAPT